MIEFTELNDEAKAQITKAIETCEKYKGSYFFESGMNASARRYREQKFFDNNPDFSVQTSLGLLEVIFNYQESAKNVYFSKTIKLNDEKKTLAILRKLIK